MVAPDLRGYGLTDKPSGVSNYSIDQLEEDVFALVKALGYERCTLVGHDWGARAAANACGLSPGIASHLAMLSVGYGTNTPDQKLTMEQTRLYWYHWFMATPLGEKTVRADPRGFARIMWDTWAPPGWYDEQEFAATAEAFQNDDWAEVVAHSYRHRWGLVEGDPAYDADEKVLSNLPVLSTPTLVIHGDADGVNPIHSSADKERWFSGRYHRVVMPGIGHFPQRESAIQVADEILRFYRAG